MYWLVPGTNLSVIQIRKKCLFQSRTERLLIEGYTFSLNLENVYS